MYVAYTCAASMLVPHIYLSHVHVSHEHVRCNVLHGTNARKNARKSGQVESHFLKNSEKMEMFQQIAYVCRFSINLLIVVKILHVFSG